MGGWVQKLLLQLRFVFCAFESASLEVCCLWWISQSHLGLELPEARKSRQQATSTPWTWEKMEGPSKILGQCHVWHLPSQLKNKYMTPNCSKLRRCNCQDGLSSLESIRFDGSQEGLSFPPGLGLIDFASLDYSKWHVADALFQQWVFEIEYKQKEIERVMLIGSSIQMNRIDRVDEIVFSYVLCTYVLYIYIYICHICPMSSLCISICFFAYRAYHQNFPNFPNPQVFHSSADLREAAFFGFLGNNGRLY